MATQPSITFVALHAVGIIAIAADWTVIADTQLKIGLPEAKAGLPFPQVPQIVMECGLDPIWHRRLALSSRLLNAAEVVETGLADQPVFTEIKANIRRKVWAEINEIYAARGSK